MARDLKAKITLQADTKQAEKSLKKVSSTAKKAFSDIEKSGDSATSGVGKLTGGVTKLGASMGATLLKVGALTAGVAGLTRIFKSSFEAALTQEDAVSKLDAALASLGPRADSVSEALQKQATELQKLTTFGDEETIQAQALIAAFVKEEDQIKELTRVTQDFAAAKGISLGSAADLITKTFASSTNALSRYGLEVEGAANSTERLASLTDTLDSAFRGAAEAAADTSRGGLLQLANVLGDIAERLAENATKSDEARRGVRSFTDQLGLLNDHLAESDSFLGDVAIASGFLTSKILGTFNATDLWAIRIDETTGAVRDFIGPMEDLTDQYGFQAKRVEELEEKQKALTEAKREEEEATRALSEENERYLESLRKLGLISEDTTDSLEDNEQALRDVTRGFDEGRFSLNRYLDEYERIRIANLNLSEAQRSSVEVIVTQEIPAVQEATVAIQAERDAIERLRESERGRTEDFIAGSQRRTQARETEDAARGAGSEFAQIGGGMFTINEGTLTGANGRVFVVPAGPSFRGITLSG